MVTTGGFGPDALCFNQCSVLILVDSFLVYPQGNKLPVFFTQFNTPIELSYDNRFSKLFLNCQYADVLHLE